MINSSSDSVQAGSASDWHYLLRRHDRAPDSPLFPSDVETDTARNGRPYLRSFDAAVGSPLRPRAAAASARSLSWRVELFRSLPRSPSPAHSALSPSCRCAPAVRTSVPSSCARRLSEGRKVAATKSAERLSRSFPFSRQSVPEFPGRRRRGRRCFGHRDRRSGRLWIGRGRFFFAATDSPKIQAITAPLAGELSAATADADGSALGDDASSFAGGGFTEDSAIHCSLRRRTLPRDRGCRWLRTRRWRFFFRGATDYRGFRDHCPLSPANFPSRPRMPMALHWAMGLPSST